MKHSVGRVIWPPEDRNAADSHRFQFSVGDGFRKRVEHPRMLYREAAQNKNKNRWLGLGQALGAERTGPVLKPDVGGKVWSDLACNRRPVMTT